MGVDIMKSEKEKTEDKQRLQVLIGHWEGRCRALEHLLWQLEEEISEIKLYINELREEEKS